MPLAFGDFVLWEARGGQRDATFFSTPAILTQQELQRGISKGVGYISKLHQLTLIKLSQGLQVWR